MISTIISVAIISNARCATNSLLMKKMTQFVKIINVQAIEINPTETSIIATKEHLMVNFRQNIAKIVIQK